MIPKSISKEVRHLGFPSLLDRAVQGLYQLGVDPGVENR